MTRGIGILVLLVWFDSFYNPVVCPITFQTADESISDVISNWIFKETCMGELGCFSNGPPFFSIQERPLSLLPSSRETINTTFSLFTKRNSVVSQNVSYKHINNTATWEVSFDPSHNTTFIIPGFMSKMAPEWVIPLKDALLEKEDLNVWVVDWTSGDGPIYEQAVANTRVVGAEISILIEFLKNTHEVTPESIHLIGHSLGSHIAGYTGKRIRNLGRITGLDPAGPYFENVDPLVRLNRTDALFVDTIHTNAAKSRFTGFGTVESIGDYDFFPNGGHLQPGCPDIGPAIWSFFKNPLNYTEALHEIMCNHQRSVQLYISSINEPECKLSGVICDTWDDFQTGKCGNCEESPDKCVAMGHPDDKLSFPPSQKSRNIFLRTGSIAPFCVKD